MSYPGITCVCFNSEATGIKHCHGEWLRNLTAKSSKTPNFILQGNTTTEREIIKFKEKLEASSFFKDVTFKSSNLTAGEKDTPGKLQFALEFNLENKKVDGITSEKKDIK